MAEKKTISEASSVVKQTEKQEIRNQTVRKQTIYSGNREYKSDVISMLLRIPKYALDVYNAMNGSDYMDPELIQIMLLENGISLSVRNDASFFINNYLNLYEHQSTYSPNAPLRFLIYLTNLIKQTISKRDLYGRRLVPIATPHFAVFYNGTEERPDREELRLSDAFINETDAPEIELVCTVYNINPDHNADLLAKSEVLQGYMCFVNRVRKNISEQKRSIHDSADKQMAMQMANRMTDKSSEQIADYMLNQSADPIEINLESAITEAIDYCINNHILKEFFRENKNEVIKNMVLDYTWERREELIREEEYEDGKRDGIVLGRAEGERRGMELGRAEGERYGLEQAVKKLVQSLHLTEEEAKKVLGV